MTEKRLHEFFEVLQAELADSSVHSKANRFATERLATRARKRARFHVPTLKDKAIDGFRAVNQIVRDFNVSLPSEVESNARHFITVMLERYTSTFDEMAIQSPLEMSFLFDNWRFGPGSSNGVKGTHTVQKLQQRMTCNTQSAPLVQRLRRSNVYLHRFDCDEKVDGISLIRGSRLATVPKNEETERTIAIEPSGQMALQLAAGLYLEGTLRYIGLDIQKQQPKNKAYACRGSIDNSLATVDMKSASDMISIDLVRRLFPPQWFNLLMTLRSREIELPNGEWVEMHMISTMGNGFTFPLMTLIIVALIYAYRCENRGPSLFIDWKDTCVFGDDIIIPAHEYQGVCEVLTQAGFVVNNDKSFSDGPFRESCGGDYYEGVDVTPFYVKSLCNNPDVYTAINQVTAWTRKTKVLLPQTLTFLKGCIRGKVFFVPEWMNPDQGIQTTRVPRRYKFLLPAPQTKKLSKNSPFAMMLAVGGYITPDGTDLIYTPRSSNVRYVVRETRLPKGYLEGYDPEKGSYDSAIYTAFFIDICFGRKAEESFLA